MRFLLAAVLCGASMVAAAAEIPRPAPEFSFVDQSGRTVKLSDQKGKVVVLEFLLTTCSHCQNSARHLSKLNKELGARGFQPLAVVIDPQGDPGAFIRTYGVNFPLGKVPQEAAHSFLQRSVMAGVMYMPQMVLVDRKGVIRAQYGGNDSFFAANEEANIRSLVEKHLAEGGPSAPAAKKPTAARKKVS
jgi:peroxiredoxin